MSEKDNKYGQGFRDYGAGVGAGALIGAGAGEAVYQKGKKYPHTGGPKSSPFIYRDAKKGVPGTKFDPPVNPKTGRPYGKGTQTYKKAEKTAAGRPGHSGMPGGGFGTADERGEYRKHNPKHSDKAHAGKVERQKKRIAKTHKRALGYGIGPGIAMGGAAAAAYREMKKRRQRGE